MLLERLLSPTEFIIDVRNRKWSSLLLYEKMGFTAAAT
jgi:hypothetical protein